MPTNTNANLGFEGGLFSVITHNQIVQECKAYG